MDLNSFLLMRHELLLTAVALALLLFELFLPEKQRQHILNIGIFLLLVTTIIGFLPIETGRLFGGMYETNPMVILYKNILNIGVLIVFMQAGAWIHKDPDDERRTMEFMVLLLATLIGMNFMISAGDMLMFYLGLELATIPLASLAAYELGQKKSAEAGIKFILSAAMSSGVTLFGISLVYGVSGSIYFAEIAQNYGAEAIHVLAFLFFFAGLAFKISIVPFHFWTPDVYEGSPISVASYLSVISKGASVFIFTILLFKLFPPLDGLWQHVIYITAVLTMTIGNLFALRQKNIIRFLAFSSIAQAGFILLGIISGSKLGMATVVYFVLIYIFSNLGAFGVAQIISARTGKELIKDYNGLYLTNPKLSLVMLLSLFSLAGIPPVAGFFGKFFLFTSAASAGYYWLVLIAAINAVISLYYYLLVVRAMFIRENEYPIPRIESDWMTRLALITCVAGIILIGFISSIYDKIYALSWGM